MDDMVKRFRAWRDHADPRASLESVSTLQGRVESIMDDLANAFTKSDPLLRQVGMITLYFHLFRIRKNGGVGPMTRSMFAAFEISRRDNKVAAEAELSDVDVRLLEFDQHSQAPNDAYALNRRISIILEYLNRKYKIEFDQGKIT